MVALEHKTKGFTPQPGQFVTVQGRDVFPGEAVFARGRSVEAAEDVHQRRLAGAGCTDNRHELPGMDRQVDATQYVNFRRVATAVGFADVRKVDQGRVHSAATPVDGTDQQVIALLQAVEDLYPQAVADAGAHVALFDAAIAGDYLRGLPV